MAQVSIYQTGTRTSRVETGSIGQEITLNKPMIVTGLIIPNSFSANSQVYPYIYRKSDGVRVGSGPIKQQTAINENEIYPVSPPVRLEANTSYVIAFAKNDTNAFYFSLNNVLNDSVTEPTTGIVLTYKGGGLTGSQSIMPANASSFPSQDFCFGIVGELPANGKIKNLTQGAQFSLGGHPLTLLNPSAGYVCVNSNLPSMWFDADAVTSSYNPNKANTAANYLNSDWYNNFTAAEKALILTKDWGIGPSSNENAATVSAKIGMLSYNEVKLYSKSYAGAYAPIDYKWSWTRTPSAIGNSNVWYTYSDGLLNLLNVRESSGIRPAFFLNPEAEVVNGVVVPNNIPVVNITSPANNTTLYENNTLNIDGSAIDTDIGNAVTIKYQIDSGAVRNIASGISDGVNPISFTKNLTYSEGVLKDGTNVLTSVLSKDTPHTLSVWAEDDKGGKSPIVTRTFYVVPNRPPTLTLDPIAPLSDLINSNTITFSGSVGDADNNDVTVKFKINDGEAQQIYSGPPSTWTFNIMLKDLKTGANTLTIEVTDIYNAKVSKVLTINKNHEAVPVNQAAALYKIIPPTGSARKILLWIERMLGDLAITTEVSMTNDGELENFVPMPRTRTEPINSTTQEDEFAYDAGAAKTNIILKVNYNRTDSKSVQTIKKISGVLS